MKCTNCGNETKEGAKFCAKCGKRILEQQDNIDNVTVSEEGKNITAKQEERTFHFEKVKMIGILRYKIIRTEARCNGDKINIQQNIHGFLRKDKENNFEIKLSEISTVDMKTKMDFWDTLYAAIFGVIFLLNITDLAWILFIVLFLYTGYGKIINLKLKTGFVVDIPVHGISEDVEEFQRLCNSAR